MWHIMVAADQYPSALATVAEGGAQIIVLPLIRGSQFRHIADSKSLGWFRRGTAEAMLEFRSHADATNDIFHVAAQALAKTAAAAQKLLGSRSQPLPPLGTYDSVSIPVLSTDRSSLSRSLLITGCSHCRVGLYTGEHHNVATQYVTILQHVARICSANTGQDHNLQGDYSCCRWRQAESGERWDSLQRAWVPLQAGWKALWWEAVAVPPDVEDGEQFRQGETTLLPINATCHPAMRL